MVDPVADVVFESNSFRRGDDTMEIAPAVDTLHRIRGDQPTNRPTDDALHFLFAFAHFVYFIVASCICNRCWGRLCRFECVDAHLGRIGPEYDVYPQSRGRHGGEW